MTLVTSSRSCDTYSNQSCAEELKKCVELEGVGPHCPQPSTANPSTHKAGMGKESTACSSPNPEMPPLSADPPRIPALPEPLKMQLEQVLELLSTSWLMKEKLSSLAMIARLLLMGQSP